MVISNNFISDSVLFLRNTLRNTLTDPISRGGDNSSFIFTAFPKTNTQYPLIVVKNTGINTKKLGMASEVNWVNAKYEIKVFARNSKECDDLTQKIIDNLRSNQFGTSSTNAEELFGFKLENCVPVVSVEGDNTIHMKVLSFLYSNILT